jgi:DegV family protein with EDD domain
MKTIITAESTIDLPEKMLEKYGIRTIPFGITFDDKLQQDRFGISSEIFEFVEKTKTLPKTCAISPAEYKDFFESVKKDCDAIIHISLSSLLSSSYSNAVTASKEMENVYVVDSRNLSTGIALLAMVASNLAKKDKDPKDIYNAVIEKVTKVQSSFIIDKLNFLHKGGRCSALSLLGANILKIKPKIVVDNGKMIVGKKYMGSLKGTCEKYCDELLKEHPNADMENVFITHSSEMPEIEDILTSKLSMHGFKHIHNTLAGGTVSSHCGPNTIGILFLEK